MALGILENGRILPIAGYALRKSLYGMKRKQNYYIQYKRGEEVKQV